MKLTARRNVNPSSHPLLWLEAAVADHRLSTSSDTGRSADLRRALNGKPDAKRLRLKETTVKAATINRELAVLSHLLNSAVDWGWIDRRPCRIRKLREDSGRITYLTSNQAKALLDSAKEDSNTQIYAFIRIGLETGMRLSEILSISKSDIDFERRRIHIPKAKAGQRDQPDDHKTSELSPTVLRFVTQGYDLDFPFLRRKDRAH